MAKPKTPYEIYAPSEAQILKAIVDWLEAHRILYVRHNPSTIIGKNRKQGDPVRFRRTRPSQVGAPDLIVFPGKGHTVFLEVKAPGKQLSKAQKHWWVRADHAGLQYWPVFSLDQAVERIKAVE